MTDTAQEEGDITLESILRQEVDEGSRTIYVFEDLDAPLLRRIIPALNFMGEDSDEPITLECASPGGSDVIMYALADAIEGLDVPVHLRAYGTLSSAATVLFAVCEDRYVGQYCEGLLHAFETDLDGSYMARDLSDRLKCMRASVQRWAALLTRRTNQEVLDFEDLVSIGLGDTGERRLVGCELVAAGLADGLLSEPAKRFDKEPS